jgi:hypothetical protein
MTTRFSIECSSATPATIQTGGCQSLGGWNASPISISRSRPASVASNFPHGIVICRAFDQIVAGQGDKIPNVEFNAGFRRARKVA